MAELGHDVIGIDVDEQKIAALRGGQAPFFEPGLPDLLRTHVSSGRLAFSSDFSQVRGARLHFVTVGTPQRTDGHAADLRYVEAALSALLPRSEERRVGKEWRTRRW